ncbi:GLPGLI family protein [Chitinophaga sp. G-6-1-13]|uniref:GLPGLI family protein n=1 Tax=Chitinophaga fulva TaxID=2728842 RepID=A0A848GE88_9BACT|nr:GLPGLI family protein [Chitinophaga fulva]NML36814.1 GLPGLI family protein [Chitinophaga fulva]
MRLYLKLFAAVVLLHTFYSFKNVSPPPVSAAFYSLSHIRDTADPTHVWNEDFMLVFNPEKSVYTSYTALVQDSAQQATIKQAYSATGGTIDMGVLRPSTRGNIYTPAGNDFLYILKNFRQNDYLIRESFENIAWKIEKDTKQLLGYTCQKATGTCKGRAYTAWFTTDIPAKFGPWKLHGLPGLILEATDSNKRIQFTCTKILLDVPPSHQSLLAFPADAVATTTEAYRKMEKAYEEGLNTNGGTDSEIKVSKVTVNGFPLTGSFRKKMAPNYPLELEK